MGERGGRRKGERMREGERGGRREGVAGEARGMGNRERGMKRVRGRQGGQGWRK